MFVLSCLYRCCDALPPLERRREDPDSCIRIGLSLLPIAGTVMYAYNLMKAYLKFDELSDSTNMDSADPKFEKDLKKYSALVVTSHALLTAIVAVCTGIFSTPVIVAGSLSLVSSFVVIYLGMNARKTKELCQWLEGL